MVEPQVPGFTLGAILGRGGAATVWAAVRDRDDRPFAIKVVPVTSGDPGDTAAQAVREIGVLSRVDNDHLVRLHAAVPVDGAVALVIDLVEGGSLACVVAARGHLRAGEVVTTLTPVCRAVAALHAAGVVHADLSPANVLFTPEGKPMLSDLGVAGLIGERPVVVHGTAGFVAPEVADGGVPSPESDVYAIGALAWHSLLGSPPAPASERASLAALVPGLPEELVDAVARCLDSDPARRPNAATVAIALFDAAPAEPVRLAAGPDAAAQVTHRIRLAALDTAPALRSRRRRVHPSRQVLAIAGACVLAVSLIGAGTLWWVFRPGPSAPQASALPSATAPSAPTITSPSPSPKASAAPTASAAPGSRRDGIRAATVPVLQGLADARAAALVAKDRGRLAAVYLPGSGPLRKDEDNIAQVTASGASYVGLRLVVREARWVSGTADEARVRARIDTSAYTTRYADGRQTTATHPPAAPVLLTLVWTDAGWRISRLAAA